MTAATFHTRDPLVSDPAERDSTSEELLAQAFGADPQRRDDLYAEVVRRHLDFATGLAERYRGRGEEQADLVQVARLGLVLAVHRYQPASGVPFTAFATPTILGELRRHFRDHAWTVRPPRRLQELRPQVVRAQDDLTATLGRVPTVNEVAERVGCPVGDAIEALTLSTAYRPESLDATADGHLTAAETLTCPENRIDELDARLSIGPEVRQLPVRSRHVLQLRYVQDYSQRQIADAIGVSQMHVSRILNEALRRVRTRVLPQH